jgi:hypothetical protein
VAIGFWRGPSSWRPCLSEGADVAAALRAYEGRWIARTTPLVKRSRRAADMSAWRDPLRSWQRDFLFGKVLPGPALRELRETVAVPL